MRTTIAFILGLLSHQLVGQTNWAFHSKVQFDLYTEFKGIIGDKYQITMRLEETAKPCNDMGTRWTPRLVYGWYQYDKIGKRIPLVGHVCYADMCETSMKLFVPKDTIDYQFDENCDLKSAKEIFFIPDGSSRMVWKMENGKTLPVDLKTTHPSTWKTRAVISLNINGQKIADFNLNKIAENEYIEQIQILAQKMTGKTYHLIIKYNHQSNPGSFGHGNCGAGIEEYIGYLKVDQNFELAQFDQIQTSSCINSFDEVSVKYDLQNPELGIIKN